MTKSPHTLVIGAGIGGLTAGALLLKAGHRVTVLEAHVYPGGSAGTFYHTNKSLRIVIDKLLSADYADLQDFESFQSA